MSCTRQDSCAETSDILKGYIDNALRAAIAPGPRPVWGPPPQLGPIEVRKFQSMRSQDMVVGPSSGEP